MRGKIERPNGVGLFKELLFIRPNVLGLHPTLNLKKNVKYFFVTFTSKKRKNYVYYSHQSTIELYFNIYRATLNNYSFTTQRRDLWQRFV